MTPGDIFTIVRDAYYREYPDGGEFEGFPVVGGYFVRTRDPDRYSRALMDISFRDGNAVIQQHMNGTPIAPDKVLEYADPEFLNKMLKVLLRRESPARGL